MCPNPIVWRLCKMWTHVNNDLQLRAMHPTKRLHTSLHRASLEWDALNSTTTKWVGSEKLQIWRQHHIVQHFPRIAFAAKCCQYLMSISFINRKQQIVQATSCMEPVQSLHWWNEASYTRCGGTTRIMVSRYHYYGEWRLSKENGLYKSQTRLLVWGGNIKELQ